MGIQVLIFLVLDKETMLLELRIDQQMGCSGYDTKLHLIVRFQSLCSEGVGEVPVHCLYSLDQSDLEGGSHIWVK